MNRNYLIGRVAISAKIPVIRDYSQRRIGGTPVQYFELAAHKFIVFRAYTAKLVVALFSEAA